jgi:hypothetical protein
MSHPCQDGNWDIEGVTNRLVVLRNLVKTENLRQDAAGCSVGAWAYWMGETDFLVFRDCFCALGYALDTPFVPPGEWTGGPVPPPGHPDLVNMLPILPATSAALGAASQMVLSVMGYDELHRYPTGELVHPESGTIGWLGSGVSNPLRYKDAEKLFAVMRNALDR